MPFDNTLTASPEGLEHIGFNAQTAQQLSEKFRAGTATDLLHFLWAHIEAADPNQNKSDRDALEAMGINQQLRDAITDPRYHKIRMTETLRFWVKDSIHTNLCQLRLDLEKEKRMDEEK